MKNTDHEGIHVVMKNKETECVLIQHKNSKAHKSKIDCCVVFRTFDNLPFGEFVSYVALNEKFKLTSLDQTIVSTRSSQQLFRQGIGRRLLSFVQFISWVKVRNISIHSCATSKSMIFYQLIRFMEYETNI